MYRVLFVCAALAVVGSASQSKPRAPTLLWASEQIFGTTTDTSVSYRTMGFKALWTSFLEEFVNAKPTGLFPAIKNRPNVLLLFISNDGGLWQLSGDRSLSASLMNAFKASASGFAFNNIHVQDGGIMNAVPGSSNATGIQIQSLGECPWMAMEGTVISGIRSVLSTSTDDTQVVVVCGNGNLSSEMEEIKQINQMLADSEVAYVMSFVSSIDPSIEEEQYINAARRRILQEKDANTTAANERHCDSLCQTQVLFLEGIILALILSVALTAGLCCLHILDAPSQFEKPEVVES